MATRTVYAETLNRVTRDGVGLHGFQLFIFLEPDSARLYLGSRWGNYMSVIAGGGRFRVLQSVSASQAGYERLRELMMAKLTQAEQKRGYSGQGGVVLGVPRYDDLPNGNPLRQFLCDTPLTGAESFRPARLKSGLVDECQGAGVFAFG